MAESFTTEIVRTYKAAPGARFSDKKAAQIGVVLEKMGDSVTPVEVVNEARKKTSPLHDQFEWDDKKAAGKWRLQQARHILGHINVVVTMPGGESSQIRAFHSLNCLSEEEGDDEAVAERRYVHISVAEREPEAAEDIVAEARRELAQWKRRYEAYSSYFGEVFSAIESVA